MLTNKKFLNLKILRIITLTETIKKITPNFKSCIDVLKTINNIPSYSIKELGNSYAIIVNPSSRKKIVGCIKRSTRSVIIDEPNFVLD